MGASLAARAGEQKRKMSTAGPVDLARFDPPPGVAETIAPGLRRLLAPNPSPMTFRGTNTYLLGAGSVGVIDPGPALPDHLDAILAALGPDERISHILVTHSHLDHSPLARPLAEATGAPVLAFGPSGAGRSPTMARAGGGRRHWRRRGRRYGLPPRRDPGRRRGRGGRRLAARRRSGRRAISATT